MICHKNKKIEICWRFPRSSSHSVRSIELLRLFLDVFQPAICFWNFLCTETDWIKKILTIHEKYLFFHVIFQILCSWKMFVLYFLFCSFYFSYVLFVFILFIFSKIDAWCKIKLITHVFLKASWIFAFAKGIFL